MVLTDRQQSILNCIVIDHIKTANPIASETFLILIESSQYAIT